MRSKAARSLQHIIENPEAIARYTEGMTLTQFEEDRRTYDAVERCLQRITEAVIRLGDPAAEELMPGSRGKEYAVLGTACAITTTASRKIDCSR